jgi:hypothetical protein
MRRRMLPVAIGIAVAALVAGCGSPRVLEPRPTATAVESAPSASASASAVEPTASASPTAQPSTAPAAEAAETPPTATGPTATAPTAVTPPPPRPLPDPDVRVIEEVPAGGPAIVGTERYDVAVVCDSTSELWTDDGDARWSYEAEGPQLLCEAGDVMLAFDVPGYWAKLWTSVEADVPVPTAERRLIGQPFGDDQVARIAAASGASHVDVTMNCHRYVGSVFALGERVYRCVEPYETIGFAEVPLAEALVQVRPPESWGGDIRLSP